MHPQILEIKKLFELIRSRYKPSEIYNLYKAYFEQFGPPPSPCYIDALSPLEGLFRCRPHLEDDGNYFYKNVSELSYRTDEHNIKDFGRCNEPGQAVFYCSSNSVIAYAEIADLIASQNLRPIEYFTVGVWKIKRPLLVCPIFEDDSHEKLNTFLKELKTKLFEFLTINKIDHVEARIDFVKLISKEFITPFSQLNSIYQLSAAYSNHVINRSGKAIYNPTGESIDGIIFPSCSTNHDIRERGLNLALKKQIVGFGNKIEFAYAIRGKLLQTPNEYLQVEEIYSEGINRESGEIFW